MKFVIITQVGNKEDRIYDWIKYHQCIGFDTFIIYDDHSKDNTVKEIEKAKIDFKNINIILNYTDTEGNFYDVEKCKNSEDYGNDPSLDRRLQRSYTKGNDIVKSINPDAYCCLLDQDEFIFSNAENLNIIENTFISEKCCQILIYSFDILDNYELKKGFLFENEFVRWEYSELNSGMYKGRCKPVYISKHLDVCNYVHVPIQSPDKKSYEFRNYDDLRILHFRKPNLPKSEHYKCCEDMNFKKYLNKIK